MERWPSLYFTGAKAGVSKVVPFPATCQPLLCHHLTFGVRREYREFTAGFADPGFPGVGPTTRSTIYFEVVSSLTLINLVNIKRIYSYNPTSKICGSKRDEDDAIHLRCNSLPKLKLSAIFKSSRVSPRSFCTPVTYSAPSRVT